MPVTMNIPLSSLSKFRSELMGIATLMIILCHANVYGVYMPSIMSRVCGYGNFGVDIFLLVSGVGISYSIQRSGITGLHDLVKWYRKRYSRILIPYLLVSITILSVKTVITDGDWLVLLYNLSTLSFWTHHNSAWYVALLIPLYLLSPLFYRISNMFVFNNIKLGGGMLALAAQVLSMYHFMGENVIWENITFCLCRVTSFFIGMALAPVLKAGHNVNILYVLFTFLPLYYLSHNLFPNDKFQIFLVLPIISMMIWLLEKVSNEKLNNTLVWISRISLESYLCNIYLCVFTKQIGIYSYIFVIVAGFILSIIFNRTSVLILQRINKSHTL